MQQFQVTIDFLKELRPPPWVLTAIIPDGHTTTVTVHTVEETIAFLDRHNGKQNLYYTLNATRTAMSKKPKKADIVAVEYLHADCDPAERTKHRKMRRLVILGNSKMDLSPRPQCS